MVAVARSMAGPAPQRDCPIQLGLLLGACLNGKMPPNQALLTIARLECEDPNMFQSLGRSISYLQGGPSRFHRIYGALYKNGMLRMRA